MKVLKFTFFIFLASFATSLQAQEQTESINEGTIDQQFEFVLRKSGNFRGTDGQSYEAVKRSMLLTLQAHTIDSLNTLQGKLNTTRNTVITQQNEINELKTNLENTQNTLNTTNAEKNSMSLFGLQMSKTGYNILMWSIIAGLFALLLIFIYKFKNSNAITKSAKSALAEVETEFEEHRRVALEREQKVRRQLQDEINKQKGN
ncbi:tRNA (guanine-N1)-methyltransferase [Pontimicrobium aquaticum]|uniref:tRNA (Guanine-N1)-methyltransferase n=1 Tax=Pontimicrobium aquaticum TaxID=2565367 RepID=A0A4U0F0E2_9FLAO|nr:tRNA (guanine-N1)-methyltransferase [Pontimicrobium aquaticum]TJY36112.1 tRNA (guanine-N1)-methyltransferase [Pontimicrobium aquaticum]